MVMTGLALLIIRLGVGVELLAHGWPKIRKPSAFAGMLGQMGMKGAMFWAWVVALVEFLGGLGLVLGFLTRPAAFFVALEFF